MKNYFKHRMRRQSVLAIILCMALWMMTGCGDGNTPVNGETGTSVTIVEPPIAETVTNETQVTTEEPASTTEQTPTAEPTATPAATPKVSAYNGTPDTSWYTGKKTEYTLYTAEQLMGFQELRKENNSFEGILIKLGDDIIINAGDVEDIEETAEECYKWAVLDSDYEFKGVFDGQGHTISGVYMQLGKSGNKGMFGTLGESSVVKNFTLDNSYFVGPKEDKKNTFGAIAGQITGSNVIISNVTLNDVIVKEGKGTNLKWVGGFVGKVNAAAGLTMENCSFNGKVSVTGEAGGGFIGFLSHSKAQVTMKNCAFNGSVKAGEYAGGMIGYAKKYKTLIIDINCTFPGKVTCSGENFGSITGNDGK